MSTPTLGLLDVVRIVREEMLGEGLLPNNCISASRVLIEVLRYFELDAQPLAVAMAAFNEAAWDEQNGQPFDPLPPGGWSVGIAGSGQRDVHGPNGWDGHLVVLVDGRFLADPTLDQASRPQHNLSLTPSVFAIEDWMRAPEPRPSMLFRMPDNVRIIYGPMPQDSGWRGTPDWSGHVSFYRRITGRIIRRLKNVATEGSQP